MPEVSPEQPTHKQWQSSDPDNFDPNSPEITDLHVAVKLWYTARLTMYETVCEKQTTSHQLEMRQGEVPSG